MTPDERIAELMAERAVGTITPPRRPVVRAQTQCVESKPTDPVAGRSLPEAWRNVADDFANMNRRQRAIKIETRIAAWAIARCLGVKWHAEPPDWGNHNRINIVHRDGFGFSLMRAWNDPGRFRISPLRRYRRDEGPPAEISVSASRTFGAIATDIRRRMIDAGLKDAHDKDVNAERERRAEIAARFAALTIVARAAGGQFLPQQRWQSDGYPAIEIPGGTASWSYGDKVRIEIDLSPKQAIEVGRILKRLRTEADGYDK
jgi:hypothetical protein